MTQNIIAKCSDTIIDPNAVEGDPTRKYTNPKFKCDRLIDLDKYYDKSHCQKEFEKLFEKSWLCAGRESDLVKSGDWFKFDLGHESIIIVKGVDDQLRGFFNVCHHRGARLLIEDAGTSAKFVCGFHGWTWNLDGSLQQIPDEESFDPNLVCDRPGLTPVCVDTWGGFVFVSLCPNPPPLDVFLDDLPDQLKAYRMQDMVLISDVCAEWPVNWKIALEAFMEGYHIHKRHPEGLSWIEDYHLQHDFFKNGHSRMILPVPMKSSRLKDRHSLNDDLRMMLEEVGLESINFEGKASAVRKAIQDRKPEWAARVGLDFSSYSPSQLTDDWNYFMFPNMTFNAHAEGVLVMRFLPHESDPEKCYYHIWVLAHKVNDPNYRLPRYMGAPNIDLSAEVPRPPRHKFRHGIESLSFVLDQDAEFVPRVQAGIKSKAFKGLRLSRQEARIRAFYQEYDRYMKGDFHE